MYIIEFVRDMLNPPMYKVEGECLKCGQCCRQIYTFDDYTVSDFQLTQLMFPKYRRFKIRGRDKLGNLVLTCTYQEGNLCRVHDKRLSLCKKFPNPRFGSLGAVPKGCGFRLVPTKSFEEVFQSIENKRTIGFLTRRHFVTKYLTNKVAAFLYKNQIIQEVYHPEDVLFEEEETSSGEDVDG